MEKFRIVADSAGDIKKFDAIPFACAPLKILAGEREFVDDASLDIKEMVEYLGTYKGRSSTSCPSVDDWMSAFADAENVFCVTITATLSGSYNSACVAADLYMEKYPGRKVYVVNSLSTGPEMLLIMEKMRELIAQDMSFEKIVEEIKSYCATTALLFMLESMKNLANNGRVSPVVAKAAGLLGIRVVGRASDVGDLDPLDKCRGRERGLDAMFSRMVSLGYKGGKGRLAHCLNREAAEGLRGRILAAYPDADFLIYELGGLCSFYAEKGGMIMGFET